MYPDLRKDMNLEEELIQFLERSLIDSGIPDAAHNANVKKLYILFGLMYNRKTLFTLLLISKRTSLRN